MIGEQINSFALKSPVLLIAFNRPDTTEKVFQKIREAQPQKLYVAIDGHRKEKAGEEQLVEHVKRITKNVDWDCEVHYKCNEFNLGAEITVSTAVSWALEKEEAVIVLEDDIIAPRSFLIFAHEMLVKYKNNAEVFMISGGQFAPINNDTNDDYYFSLYGHTGCGWATWKRAWHYFNLYPNNFDECLKKNIINDIALNRFEYKFLTRYIKITRDQEADKRTWDRCWFYARIINLGLSIVPRVNLTSNIGIYGLHAKGKTESHYRAYDEKFVVKSHPKTTNRNIEYDLVYINDFIKARKRSLSKRILKKLLKIVSS
jgi:hypothetical protein